jgi:hypothetical protein
MRVMIDRGRRAAPRCSAASMAALL